MDALILFKGDMVSFVRVYTFLSQIFDYARTDIEKRFLFFKHLIKLRERETVDLSQLVLTGEDQGGDEVDPGTGAAL